MFPLKISLHIATIGPSVLLKGGYIFLILQYAVNVYTVLVMVNKLLKYTWPLTP